MLPNRRIDGPPESSKNFGEEQDQDPANRARVWLHARSGRLGIKEPAEAQPAKPHHRQAGGDHLGASTKGNEGGKGERPIESRCRKRSLAAGLWLGGLPREGSRHDICEVDSHSLYKRDTRPRAYVHGTASRTCLPRAMHSQYQGMMIALRNLRRHRYNRIGFVNLIHTEDMVNEGWLAAYLAYHYRIMGEIIIPPCSWRTGTAGNFACGSRNTISRWYLAIGRTHW